MYMEDYPCIIPTSLESTPSYEWLCMQYEVPNQGKTLENAYSRNTSSMKNITITVSWEKPVSLNVQLLFAYLSLPIHYSGICLAIIWMALYHTLKNDPSLTPTHPKYPCLATWPGREVSRHVSRYSCFLKVKCTAVLLKTDLGLHYLSISKQCLEKCLMPATKIQINRDS